ncbi:MAG: ATP-binding protein [Planctomycetia bacterium]|nr:ATP-binding protein [Planctomycetia bacterium]
MKENELTLEASPENLGKVLEFVEALPEFAVLRPKDQNQLMICIEEIFVNIVHYAYSGQTGSITVQCGFEEETNQFRLRFIDAGIPFNPLEAKDPDISLPPEDRQIGGLGIFIVRKFMDRIDYQNIDGKNILTLAKNREER